MCGDTREREMCVRVCVYVFSIRFFFSNYVRVCRVYFRSFVSIMREVGATRTTNKDAKILWEGFKLYIV